MSGGSGNLNLRVRTGTGQNVGRNNTGINMGKLSRNTDKELIKNLPTLTFWSVFAFLLISDIPHGCDSANILSVSFFSSRSHSIVFEPLLVKLVESGHHLTIISPEHYAVFSSNSTFKNSVVQINGKKMEDYGQINFIQSRIDQNYLAEPLFFATILEPLCRSYLEMPQVKELLTSSNRKFDLIITSAMMNECSLGYISQFDAPYILTIPFSPLAVTAAIFGAPSPNSFVPVPVFSSSTHRMTFLERVQNMIISTFISLSFHWYTYPMVEGVYRSILGDHVPSVSDIQRNASLILTNSHFTLNYPRPVMPDIVEIGGMHCRPGRQLPKDLDDFINASGSHGFIYISFGSVIKSTDMPDEHRKIFVKVFSKLKQRVVWKWENETMKDAPANVKLTQWAPQQDVLAHPKIKLFISHGGLLSIQETVYHGVPLVGLPIFADQDWNMAQAEASGYGVTLNFRTLTEELLTKAIEQILVEVKFRDNAKALSKVFKDRLQDPLDSAVYWTEYIIRHHGAPQLRSAARGMNFVEYYSIDVLAFIGLMILYVIYLIYRTFAFVIFALRIIFGSLWRSCIHLKKVNEKLD